MLLLLLLNAGAGISVEYLPARTPAHQELRRREVSRQTLEPFASLYPVLIRLPRQLTVSLRECDSPNAYWEPRSGTIVLCYSYYDLVAELVGDARVHEVIAFTLMHEMGHALVSELDLAVVGREEDAADRFAMVVALSAEEVGDRIVTSAARFFRELAIKRKPTFWDEHTVAGTRFYDMACQMLGARPRAYAKYFASDVLPAERAERCPSEYRQAVNGWNALLQPYSNVKGGKTF